MQDAKHIMKINEEHWNDVNSNFSCYKFDYDAAIYCITLRFGSRFYIGGEYMQKHDGGDRVEDLQEVEHSDSSFYVPPSNDASQSSD